MIITAAARLSASQFNHGSKSFIRLLEVTRTPGGRHSLSAFKSLDDARIKSSEYKATVKFKKSRGKRRKRKKQGRDRQEQEEGPTYGAGAFGVQGNAEVGARGRGRVRGTRGRTRGRARGRGRGREPVKGRSIRKSRE